MKFLIATLLVVISYSQLAYSNDQLVESMGTELAEKKSRGLTLYNSNDSKKAKKGIAMLEEVAKYDSSVIPIIWTYYVERPDLQVNYPDLEKVLFWSETVADFGELYPMFLSAIIYRFDKKYNNYDLEKATKIFKRFTSEAEYFLNSGSLSKDDTIYLEDLVNPIYFFRLHGEYEPEKISQRYLKENFSQNFFQKLASTFGDENKKTLEVISQEAYENINEEELEKIFLLENNNVKDYLRQIYSR